MTNYPTTSFEGCVSLRIVVFKAYYYILIYMIDFYWIKLVR
jgi:hypothetical protein